MSKKTTNYRTTLLHQRSDAVNEIISKEPSFVSKWALTIFLGVLLVVFSTSWFIQYPDIIHAKAVLGSINSPKGILCKSEGKLVALYVKEGDLVSKGKVLGFLESIADPEEVLSMGKKVEGMLSATDLSKMAIGKSFKDGETRNLGEIQLDYQVFMQALINYENYTEGGFIIRKRALLYQDIASLKKLHQNLLDQKAFQREDMALAQANFDADDTLKKKKVISELEYRNERSKFLYKKLTLPQMNASLIANESEQTSKQKEILEVENAIHQSNAIFMEALLTFKSRLEEWKKKYVLEAPSQGKVVFTSFLQVHQSLKIGQVFCYINPENLEYYATLQIPQINFGKIRLGQRVLLKLSSYPSEEYGYLSGKITYISSIASDSGYLSKVVLVDGLKTTYHKVVGYHEGMIADAQIITNDLRLAERLYYNFSNQFQR